MAPINVRRLAAIDLHGLTGSALRRWLVLGEFVAATLIGLTLGTWILANSGSSAGRVVGAWAAGIGVNYVPLAVHALTLMRSRALTASLSGVHIASELRRYSILQAWVLVPFLLAGLAVVQLRPRSAS